MPYCDDPNCCREYAGCACAHIVHCVCGHPLIDHQGGCCHARIGPLAHQRCGCAKFEVARSQLKPTEEG